MMKIFKYLIVLVFMFTFIACNECEHDFEDGKCILCDEPHNCVFNEGKCECGKTIEIKYNVKFVDYDDSILKEVEVIKNENAVAPEDPKRNEYDFIGWDKEFTNITSDIVIKAQYKEHIHEYNDGICECGEKEELKTEEYLITFNDSDLSQVKVNKGDKLTQPADPVKEGYVFRGWYLDSEYTLSYDFNSVVNANLELYAKWIEYTKVIKNNDNIAILDKDYINKNKEGNSITIDNNIKLIYGSHLTSANIENLYFNGTEEKFRNIKIYGDFNANVYINNELINFEVVINSNKDYSSYNPESLVTIEVEIYLNNEFENTSKVIVPINAKLNENYIVKMISAAEALNSWNGLAQCFLSLYDDENKVNEFDFDYFNNVNESKKIYAFFEEKDKFDLFINGTYSTDNNDVCFLDNKKLTIYGNEYLLNDEFVGKNLSYLSYSDDKIYIEVKINGYYLKNELVITVLDEITGERIDNLFFQTKSIEHKHEYIDGSCVCGDIEAFNVDFVLDDIIIETQLVEYGKECSLPNVDIDGYIFKGWDYSNEPIIKDSIINAIFERVNHTVKYIGREDVLISDINDSYGYNEIINIETYSYKNADLIILVNDIEISKSINNGTWKYNFPMPNEDIVIKINLIQLNENEKIYKVYNENNLILIEQNSNPSISYNVHFNYSYLPAPSIPSGVDSETLKMIIEDYNNRNNEYCQKNNLELIKELGLESYLDYYVMGIKVAKFVFDISEDTPEIKDMFYSLSESDKVTKVIKKIDSDINKAIVNIDFLGLSNDNIINYEKVDVNISNIFLIDKGIYDSYEKIQNEVDKLIKNSSNYPEETLLSIANAYSIFNEEFFEKNILLYCGASRSATGFDEHYISNTYVKDGKISVIVEIDYANGGIFNVAEEHYFIAISKDDYIKYNINEFELRFIYSVPHL